MSYDVVVAVLRFAVGLILAGHGAMKAFGLFEGPGMERWTGNVRGMGMRPHTVFAYASAYSELLGGLGLAIGFLTPLCAAFLAIDMAVAIRKVHWTKGFWVTKGGFEYSSVLLLILTLIGISGPGALAVDTALRWSLPSAIVYLLVAGIGIAVLMGAMRPEARARDRERRRAA